MAQMIIHESDDTGEVELIGYAEDILSRFPSRYLGYKVVWIKAEEMSGGGSGFRVTIRHPERAK